MVNFQEDTDADVDTDADGVETLEPACADDGVETTDSVLSSTSWLFGQDELDEGGVTGAGGLACTSSALLYASSYIKM